MINDNEISRLIEKIDDDLFAAEIKALEQKEGISIEFKSLDLCPTQIIRYSDLFTKIIYTNTTSAENSLLIEGNILTLLMYLNRSIRLNGAIISERKGIKYFKIRHITILKYGGTKNDIRTD